MGNLYRFVEPLVLLQLKKKGHAYGYDLCIDLQDHALTDTAVEKAALYRTLRQLESNGNVKSEWETNKAGPARRVYKLTKPGERHLEEWAAVLEHLSQSMTRFVCDVREVQLKSAKKKAKTS
jgi:poly-beta-hydroxybutyrate-responsive repressor